MSLAWHPTENVISFTTNQGQLFTLPKPVPDEHQALLKKPLQPAPLLNDEQQTLRLDRRAAPAADGLSRRKARSASMDSIDDLFGGNAGEEEDWLVDDDGAGYGEVNGNGKRAGDPMNIVKSGKRPAYSSWAPDVHESFQPGSTPWRGSRRYLRG